MGTAAVKALRSTELVWFYMLVHYMAVFPLFSMTGKVKLSDVFHMY